MASFDTETSETNTTETAVNQSPEETAIQRFRDYVGKETGTHPALEHLLAFWAGLHASSHDVPPLPASVDPRPQPAEPQAK